jgi:MoaA/NifB/PqqE/SkfB family radical SAM enzyme
VKHIKRSIREVVRSSTQDHPGVHRLLIEAETQKERARHTLWSRFPGLVRPKLKKLTIAVTANCNLRCIGCRYGRDYMTGSNLSLDTVRGALSDGREAGAETVRLYGGEPLLHPELPQMVAHAVELGYVTYITTNGILLADKIGDLYAAGLRDVTLGFYGIGGRYDEYVQRPGRYEQLLSAVRSVREQCGPKFRLQLNYLVMRPTVDLETLRAAWELCQEFDMTLHTDLIHYSLPYFIPGRDHELQFREEDRPAVQALTDELVRLKHLEPRRIPESEMSLRSIPDWLFRGPDMRLPCDAYRMVWIGADGSVRLCYVAFDLGNLHERPLAEMLYGQDHRDAARGAFELKCPNCHCERDPRVTKHGPSRRRYGR